MCVDYALPKSYVFSLFMKEQPVEKIPEFLFREEDRCEGASRLQEESQREYADVLNPRRILWEPSPEQIARSNIAAFVQFLQEEYGGKSPSMENLYQWSIENPEQFWRSFLRFSGIIYEGDDSEVLTYALFSNPHPSPLPLKGEGKHRMIDARWFPNVKLNFTENLLRYAKENPDKEAVAFFGEDHTEKHLTYEELLREVKRFSRMLDACDVQCGDRVAALMPNIPEAVSAMLATTARGALWSSVSPEFGSDTVVDRFGQLEPKVLIATDGHVYRGKAYDASHKIRDLQEGIPSIAHTVIVPSLSSHHDSSDALKLRNCVFSDDARFDGNDHIPLSFPRFPFNHPVYVLFSSGTTGKPKCIVHGLGGTLLNQLKQHQLHTDLKESDTLFFRTSTSWMMWNSLVCALGTGAKIVLYDGDPLMREGNILFDIVQKERVTVFGTSAGFLAAIEKKNLRPCETHDLSSMRTILSTGSTLYGSQFDYVYAHVHPTVQLSSTSGGTDILGAFASASPVVPVRREELQALSLGYTVEIFDDAGNPVAPGVRGELVCTAPFPSQPVMFWNDPEHKRYLATYFEKYGPTVWRHGDEVEITPSGGMVIHGRSDDTIKRAGVRIGPVEITAQAEKIPEVLEAAAVGHTVGQNEHILLFVVLREGHRLTAELQDRIRSHIRFGASPYHIPDEILTVPALPRTQNGKLSVSAIRAALRGEVVQNTDSLANPESLKHFSL